MNEGEVAIAMQDEDEDEDEEEYENEESQLPFACGRPRARAAGGFCFFIGRRMVVGRTHELTHVHVHRP